MYIQTQQSIAENAIITLWELDDDDMLLKNPFRTLNLIEAAKNHPEELDANDLFFLRDCKYYTQKGIKELHNDI